MTDINKITNMRAQDYGPPEEQHACTSSLWAVLDYFWRRNPRHLSVCGSAATKVCLSNMLQKVSRLVCGDINHADSWDDIEGYVCNARDCLGNSVYRDEPGPSIRTCIMDPDRPLQTTTPDPLVYITTVGVDADNSEDFQDPDEFPRGTLVRKATDAEVEIVEEWNLDLISDNFWPMVAVNGEVTHCGNKIGWYHPSGELAIHSSGTTGWGRE